MGKQALRSIHADPPGRTDPPTEEPERKAHANGEANQRIKECEKELHNQGEAIMALRDVVMKQRLTILSFKAERQDVIEPPFPLGEIRRETMSKTSMLSQSESSDESESTEVATHNVSPVISFDPSCHQSERAEAMSAITCEADESIHSTDSLEMEHQMREVLESVEEQACPFDAMISKASKRETSQDINDVIESIEEQVSHVVAVIALEKLQTTTNELQQMVSNELRERNVEVGELQNRVKVLEYHIATLELERDLHTAEASRAKDDLKECIQYIVKLKTKDESHQVSPTIAMTSNVGTEKTLEPYVFATPEKSSATAFSAHHRRRMLSKTDNPDQATPSTQKTVPTQQSAVFTDDRSISSFSSDGHPRRRCPEPRNLVLCFLNQRSKERRQKNRKKPRDKLPSNRKVGGHVESSELTKAAKLNRSLATADREADELRFRLHSITRYYDNIVMSLHQNASSNKTVNTEVEVDMTNHLSFLDREKRTVMAELRQKDDLVAKLQQEITQLVRSSKDDRNGFPVQDSTLFA